MQHGLAGELRCSNVRVVCDGLSDERKCASTLDPLPVKSAMP
ncbi:MAG TPA: hypothetical protein VGM99_02495 [Candidatus Cybelea sp.]